MRETEGAVTAAVETLSAVCGPPAPARMAGAPGHASAHIFAALDLGTNNCRLLIARRAPAGAGRSTDFQVIDAFARIVRLGEGLVQTGRLSDAAMDRALAALKTCADKLARRGVHRARSVATEACRSAANGAAFVARVYAETGIALDVITPAEEARLALVGCQALIDIGSPTLVFDIGGGSTELVVAERQVARLRVLGWASVPWGVVSLAETERADAGDGAARLAAFERMKTRVARHLAPLATRIGRDIRLLGASGTVTTLANLHFGHHRYDRRRIDGALVGTAELRRLSRSLAIRSPAERALLPGIGADRADLVVAGSAILEALMDLSPAEELRVADRGLREGILRSLIGREIL